MEKKRESITQKLRLSTWELLKRNETTKKCLDSQSEELKKFGGGEEDLRTSLVKPSVVAVRIFKDEDDCYNKNYNAFSRPHIEDNYFYIVEEGKKPSWMFTRFPAEMYGIEPEKIIQLLLHSDYQKDAECGNSLLLGINLDRPKEDILKEVEKSINLHWRPRKNRLSWVEKTNLYLQVWDEGVKGKTFKQIAKELQIKEATAKKRFYRVYELIFRKKYDPAYYEKPEIKKEYLKRVCNTCKEKPTCKVLCPDVIAFIEQDTKGYLREKPIFQENNLSKQELVKKEGRWTQSTKEDIE